MSLSAAYVHPLRWQSQRGQALQYAMLHKQSWVNPAAIDDDGYLEAVAGPAAASTVSFTLDGALYLAGGADYARNVIVTVTHASSIVACNGVITGTDIFGNVQTAAWAVTATGTSKTSATAKAFKQVTAATITVAADASTNTIIIGTGDVLGLDAVCVCTSPVKELEGAAAPTAGVLVEGVAAHATADAWGTYDPNSALNGALDFEIWYIVDDPQLTNASSQRAL